MVELGTERKADDHGDYQYVIPRCLAYPDDVYCHTFVRQVQ
jgi:hypothetical protein